jgi:hypothetical protein
MSIRLAVRDNQQFPVTQYFECSGVGRRPRLVDGQEIVSHARAKEVGVIQRGELFAIDGCPMIADAEQCVTTIFEIVPDSVSYN